MPVYPAPKPFVPQDPSVFDSALTKAMRLIGDLLGDDDPAGQIMGLAGAMEVPGAESAIAKAAAGLKNRIRAFHGSPKQFPELQPGSMMTTTPEWAAGYTLRQQGGIGPETLTGTLHAADVELPERVLTGRTLHDAEDQLLRAAQQVLGRPAATLREAADAVREGLGYQAVVAKDAAGNITGVIPLTPTKVAEHLDPRPVVREALRKGQMVPSNVKEALDNSSIKAFHGSPHDFDKFSLDKIGTGEGAQAYGHGLYFAEAEDVAKSYKNILGGRRFKVGDRELVSGDTTRALDQQTRGELIAAESLNDALNAQSVAPAQFASNRLRKQRQLYPEDAEHIDEALGVIGKWQESGEVHDLTGRMYEVAIDASPDEFLDWDKPLSQQPPKVLGAVQDALRQSRGETIAPYELNSETGASAYRFAGDRAQATELLKQRGVKGIQYLDGSSRTAGEGTRNYVVFDDRLVDILRKYGVAGAIGAGYTQQQILAAQGGQQ